MTSPDQTSNPTLDKQVNYMQVEYYCENCKTNHLGNCPKMKVVFSTSDNPPTLDNDDLKAGYIKDYGCLGIDTFINGKKVMNQPQKQMTTKNIDERIATAINAIIGSDCPGIKSLKNSPALKDYYRTVQNYDEDFEPTQSATYINCNEEIAAIKSLLREVELEARKDEATNCYKITTKAIQEGQDNPKLLWHQLTSPMLDRIKELDNLLGSK